MQYLHGFGGHTETLNDPFEQFDISNFFAAEEEVGQDEEVSQESEGDSWGGSWESESETEDPWGWAPAEEETDYTWSDSTEDTSWGWGGTLESAGWGWRRKKRSSDDISSLSRGVLLTEAIESLIFPAVKDVLPLSEASRKRRQAWAMNPMVGQTAGNFEDVEEQKEKLAALKCFTADRLRNDDEGREEESEEEYEAEGEEEEEGEDPLERVRMQRHGTDHKGINNWLADK